KKRHATVIEAGGLRIIGTERHESRRIDNQLRGRSGRQGDPGSSRFYLSLDDNLMRIFVSDRIKSFMQSMDTEKDEGVIESRMVSNAIEKAQRKVEGRNFDIRKQLLEYDDISNVQRLIIYQQRDEILEAEHVTQNIDDMRRKVIDDLVTEYIPPMSLEEQWDIKGLEERLKQEVNLQLSIQKMLDDDEHLNEEGIKTAIVDALAQAFSEKEKVIGEENIRNFEKHVLLRVLDEKWKEHLSTMDYLRQSIHLRGYAAKNPKDEYKREAFNLFENLLHNIRHDVISTISFMQTEPSEHTFEKERSEHANMLKMMEFRHDALPTNDFAGDGQTDMATGEKPAAKEPFVRSERKIGRNEPCPCGSGKKYKHCHGKI
ncbi:MAG: SEC-C metal-binding domain-containing protein, partial [Endozoicomonadaceae bacterium]|nr:SEC-C metal-binding domain-containing protein [Endozoicomonadaceae bacterium]